MTAATPVRFVAAMATVTEPVTKLGGQPVWIGEPQWPLSRELSAPMRFLGQFRLPGPDVRVAYLFMSDDDEEFVDDTFEPEGGENALLVQPAGRVPSFVETIELATGPTLGRELVAEQAGAGDLAALLSSRLGGEPTWLQGDEQPGEMWTFAFQLDARDADGMINFGDAGVGYGFVSFDGREGRFLWQCS
jgi:uncharacterized protein YwqG